MFGKRVKEETHKQTVYLIDNHESPGWHARAKTLRQKYNLMNFANIDAFYQYVSESPAKGQPTDIVKHHPDAIVVGDLYVDTNLNIDLEIDFLREKAQQANPPIPFYQMQLSNEDREVLNSVAALMKSSPRRR